MNDPEGYKVTSNHQSSNLILGTMTTYCNIKREGIQRSREEILRYLTYVRSPSASSLLLVSLQRNTPPSVHHKKKRPPRRKLSLRGNSRRGLPTMLTLGLKGSVEISS
jgi:hypothetical protein